MLSAKMQRLFDAAGITAKDVPITVAGITEQIRIKSLSFIDAQKAMAIPFTTDDQGNTKFDKDKVPDRAVQIIADCVLNDDGTPQFTLDEARQIPAAVGAALLKAVNDANGFGAKEPVKEAAKNS